APHRSADSLGGRGPPPRAGTRRIDRAGRPDAPPRSRGAVIVVDASVVAELLLAGSSGDVFLDRLLGHNDLYAPELMDVEVLHVLRRALARQDLSALRAQQSVVLLEALPIIRVGHEALRARIWQLRENLSAYDATYVALAEGLNATLLTRDR